MNLEHNSFSSNLKKLRLSQRLTQSKLADDLNMTKQVISNYENGKRLPDLYNLVKICKYFECSIDSILFSDSEIEKLKTISEFDTKDIYTQKDIDLVIKNIHNMNNSIVNILEFYSKSDIVNNKTEFSKELTFDIDNKTKSLLKPVDTYNNIVNINNIKSNVTVGVSFCGNISAGCPRPTFSDLNDIFYIPSHLLENNQEYFVLRINGESMNKIYQHNDYVLVKKYNHITNCFKVPFVVSVDGSESTVKFIDIDTNNHTFSLVPYSTDKSFKVQTYSFDKHKLEIIGSIECIINIKED